MKIKFLIILGVISGIMSVWYFSQERVNKEKLFKSYENYLSLESKDAEKKYGNLMKGKEVKLQELNIHKCKNKDSLFECDAEVKVKNFRGIESRNEIIIFKEMNKDTYAIKMIRGE